MKHWNGGQFYLGNYNICFIIIAKEHTKQECEKCDDAYETTEARKSHIDDEHYFECKEYDDACETTEWMNEWIFIEASLKLVQLF